MTFSTMQLTGWERGMLTVGTATEMQERMPVNVNDLEGLLLLGSPA